MYDLSKYYDSKKLKKSNLIHFQQQNVPCFITRFRQHEIRVFRVCLPNSLGGRWSDGQRVLFNSQRFSVYSPGIFHFSSNGSNSVRTKWFSRTTPRNSTLVTRSAKGRTTSRVFLWSTRKRNGKNLELRKVTKREMSDIGISKKRERAGNLKLSQFAYFRIPWFVSNLNEFSEFSSIKSTFTTLF